MAQNLGELWKKGITVPESDDLEEGGIAIDVVGKTMYSKANDGSIFQIGTDISEAPSDGSPYGRQDISWVEVEVKGSADTVQNNLHDHIIDLANPHEVNKAHVGLDAVDNTSDMVKPISTATQTALDSKEPTLGLGTAGQLLATNTAADGKEWIDAPSGSEGLPHFDVDGLGMTTDYDDNLITIYDITSETGHFEINYGDKENTLSLSTNVFYGSNIFLGNVDISNSISIDSPLVCTYGSNVTFENGFLSKNVAIFESSATGISHSDLNDTTALDSHSIESITDLDDILSALYDVDNDHNQRLDGHDIDIADLEISVNEIVEGGSNANGAWAKLIDGTLIQYGGLTIDCDYESSNRYGTESGTTWKNDPEAIITLPIPFFDFNYTAAADGTGPTLSSRVRPITSTSEFQLGTWMEQEVSDAPYGWFAIGRWK